MPRPFNDQIWLVSNGQSYCRNSQSVNFLPTSVPGQMYAVFFVVLERNNSDPRRGLRERWKVDF